MPLGSVNKSSYEGSLTQSVGHFWANEAWMDVTVMAGVSGGADSVALLRALHELRSARPECKGELCVAHFHHGVRASADLDADFVRQLASSLGLPFVLGRPQGDASDQLQNAAGHSPAEEDLRRARYEFFRQSANSLGARYLALAHTADDQVETVLHRIIRGTGLRGLSGIPERRELCHGVTVVRPLLRVTRQQVLDYLRQIGQAYREDPTNADQAYTRNALRHNLLPQLESQFNAEVRTALLRLANQADEAHQVLTDLAEDAMTAAVKFERDPADNDVVVLQRAALARLPDYIVRLVFVRVWERFHWPQQAMGENEWRRLAAAVSDYEQATSDCLPGGIRMIVDKDVILLQGQLPPAASES